MEGVGAKSVKQVRNGKHFYHQSSILILNSEAQLHLKYDAKDRLTTSHKHTKEKKTKKTASIGKIHLCPVQNMERNLYALPSQMRVQQISNIKQRKCPTNHL